MLAMRAPTLTLCLFLLCTVHAVPQKVTPEQFSMLVFDSPTSAQLTLAGTLDATHTRIYPYQPPEFVPELRMRIENLDDHPLRNPRLIFNNSHRWHSIDSLWNEITNGAESERDKALRLFWFFIYQTYHSSSDPPDSPEPIAFLNSYGAALCVYQARVLAVFCSYPQWGFRNSHAFNHCAHEYFFDHTFHHLDTDLNVYYLKHDNQTIASANDFRADPYLIKRVPHYFSYDPNVYADSSISRWSSPEKVAALYETDQSSRAPELLRTNFSTIELTLRPGEAFDYRYSPAQRLHPARRSKAVSKNLINGVLETRLDFTQERFRTVAYPLMNFKTCDQGLYLQDPQRPGIFKLQIDLPWPLTGLDVAASFSPLTAKKVKAYARLQHEEKTTAYKQLALSPAPKTTLSSLDSLLRTLPFPSRNLAVEFRVESRDRSSTPILTGLQVDTYVQLTRVSAPELHLGVNQLIYEDDNPETRKTRVLIEWQSTNHNSPPRPPAACLAPPDQEELPYSRLLFRWQPAQDPDGDEISDYHFQLSHRADMRYPLSPSFDRLLKNTLYKGKTEYKLPLDGLLAPDNTYYWRVRAIDTHGFVSDWSPVWSFKVTCPDYPRNLRHEVKENEIFLSWQAGEQGTEPVAFEIFGSNEYGFMPHTEPRLIEGLGVAKKPVRTWRDYSVAALPLVPSNLLTTLEVAALPRSTIHTLKVVSPELTSPNSNTVYYRVVAMDKHGSRSVPSPFITLPEGFIYSPALVSHKKGKPFEYQVKCLQTLGKITAQMPYFTGLWDKPRYSFTLLDAPKGLKIKQETGRVSGVPRLPPNAEYFAFTVQVLRNEEPLAKKTIRVNLD